MRLFVETQQQSHEACWVNLWSSTQCYLFIAGTARGSVNHWASLRNSVGGGTLCFIRRALFMAERESPKQRNRHCLFEFM